MTIDLKEKNLQELKALAYDLIADKEIATRNLQVVNEEISLRLQQSFGTTGTSGTSGISGT